MPKIYRRFLFLPALLLIPPSGSLTAQTAPPRLDEITIIGAEAVDGPALFARIQAVTAGPAGEIYVLDALAPRIRAFDREGTCFIAAGADGEGPGETRLPIALALAADGSFTVLDMRLNRRSVFRPDGSLDHTRPISGNRLLALQGSAFDPMSGTLYCVHLDFGAMTTVISKLPAGGDGLDEVMTVAEWPLAENGSPALFYSLAAGPGGVLAIGDGDVAYEIRIFDPAGRHLRTITREVERVRKSDEEIAREDEAMERGAERIAREGGRGVSLPRPQIDPLKHYFYVNALCFDGSGRLWVLTGRGDEARSVFDVFTPEGAWLGEVGVDRVIDVYAFRGRWLAAGGFTPEGVPVVVLYEIGA